MVLKKTARAPASKHRNAASKAPTSAALVLPLAELEPALVAAVSMQQIGASATHELPRAVRTCLDRLSALEQPKQQLAAISAALVSRRVEEHALHMESKCADCATLLRDHYGILLKEGQCNPDHLQGDSGDPSALELLGCIRSTGSNLSLQLPEHKPGVRSGSKQASSHTRPRHPAAARTPVAEHHAVAPFGRSATGRTLCGGSFR